MCSLSVLFAYKVGLFNIGAAGQYVVGVGACLYFALRFNMPWYVCLIAAIVTAALVGGISGALKAYFNVNEVISSAAPSTARSPSDRRCPRRSPPNLLRSSWSE